MGGQAEALQDNNQKQLHLQAAVAAKKNAAAAPTGKTNLNSTYLITEFDIPEDVWVIHGKQYDFSSFADRHPGGKEMLMLGRGRECTELFESVHALCSQKPHQLLAKYLIKPTTEARHSGNSSYKNQDDVTASIPLPAEAPEDKEVVEDTCACLWEETGFYNTLKARVKQHFEDNKMDYKATWGLYVKSLLLLLVSVYTFIHGFYGGSIIHAAICGLVSMMFYFCTLHDGSHFAISHKVWVNSLFSSIQYWIFWDPWTWLRHHVYGHHSFTGIFGRDPDLVNAIQYSRKHEDVPLRPRHAFQHITGWLVMTILPNQQLGQVYNYVESLFTHEIFGIKLEAKPWDPIKAVVFSLSFAAHVVFPMYFLPPLQVLLMNVGFWMFMGAAYFFTIFPNHDTDLVVESMVKSGRKVDFGELQLRHSSNHSISNTLVSKMVTLLFGGMNYQIEHHLFPSMCHVHYPSISPIVQQTAKEFGIPYNVKETWYHATIGHHAMLVHHGTK